MRKSMKSAVAETIQGMLEAALKTSFTERELKAMGVVVPQIEISSDNIKDIREKTRLSQAVFAKLLNVSTSSIRQWEQGSRHPTGPTMVLLEMLERDPHILDFRLRRRSYSEAPSNA